MTFRIDDGEFSLFGFAEDGIGFFECYTLGGGDEVVVGCHYCCY